MVFIPFTPLVGRLIIKYFPDEKKDRDVTKPAVMHLNDDVLDTPTVAISNAQAEIRGVIGLLERVVGSVAKPFISEESLKDIEDENEDFEFNQDIDYDNEIKSPGWLRYQKRIKN